MQRQGLLGPDVQVVGGVVTPPALLEERRFAEPVGEAVTGGAIRQGAVATLVAGNAAPSPVPGLIGADLREGLAVTGGAIAVGDAEVEDDGRRHVGIMTAGAVLSLPALEVRLVALHARRRLPVRGMAIGTGIIRVQTVASVDEGHLRGVTLPAGVAGARGHDNPQRHVRIGMAAAARGLVEVRLPVVTLPAAGKIPQGKGRVAAVTAGTVDFLVGAAGEREIADLTGVALDAVAVGKPGTLRRGRNGRQRAPPSQGESSEQRNNSLLHRHSPFSLGDTHAFTEKARNVRRPTRLEPRTLYWLEVCFVKFPH